MVEDMKVISKMVRKMGKALLSGLTVLSILVAGDVVNNMAQEYYMIQYKTLKSRVNGVMAKGYDGYRGLKC
jgi:hypothetical protein